MNLRSKSSTTANAVQASANFDAVVANTEQFFKILLKPLIAEAINELLPNLLTSKVSNKREEKLLTVKEAAIFMKVSTSTIHNRKREGRLPFHTIGRRILFKPCELVAALESSSEF